MKILIKGYYMYTKTQKCIAKIKRVIRYYVATYRYYRTHSYLTMGVGRFEAVCRTIRRK